MSNSYTALQYLGPVLAVFLGGFAIALLFGILLIPKLTRKFRNPLWSFSLFLIPLCMLIVILRITLPTINRLGDLLIPGEYEIKTTAGEIESVTKHQGHLYHFRNGKLHSGEEISVDGVSYYVLSEGILEEGLTISVTYAQFESNVILSWQEVTSEEAAQIRAESAAAQSQKPTEKTEPTISPQQEMLGVWLLRIGFVGMAAIVALEHLFYEKLVARRFRQISSLQGEIRINRAAVFERIAPALCMSVLCVGFAVKSGQWFVTVLLFVPMGMFALKVVDATTHLKLDGDKITIRRWGRERTYRLEDVQGVFWRGDRGLIGKTMVLVLHDGKSYWFSMDDFCGVEYAYNYISRYLEATQQ
jgi:hypothetical protein